MYTEKDARREVKELVEEGYGFDYIRIFLNDLRRGHDITREEHAAIMTDILTGKFDLAFNGFETLA